MFELIIGVLIGGAAMYYIQPPIKVMVARTFGWEAKVAAEYRARAADMQAAALAKTPATKPPPPSL